MKITAGQIAALVNGKIEGNPDVIISTYSKIEEGKTGSLTFLSNPKYTQHIYTTNASAVLVKDDFVPERPIETTLIRVADPYSTLATLLSMVSEMLRPKKVGIEQPSFVSEGVEVPSDAYVGAFAYIGANVKIGKGVQIYPQAYIGDGVVIGDNTIVYSGAKVYYGCKIGNNCILHSGCVVGSDGFGFAPKNGSFEKIAQIGIVELQDNVEIGANTTIDRATMGATVIKKGVKLDNLIQIAHNVEVGENTVMAAQVGIAGSTKIGKNNMFGGQVGIAGHITIGDYNEFGAQAGIPNSVGDKTRLLGTPAINALDYARMQVHMKRLGQVFSDVKEIKKEIEQLKELKK